MPAAGVMVVLRLVLRVESCGRLVASFDLVALLGFVPFLGGLGTVAMRWNVLVYSFEVVQAVVVSCNNMVDSVGSWLLADVADAFVSLEYNKTSC